MSTSVPRALLEVRYYQAAQDYLRNLPPEHFMESTPQAYQREIFLASMALVHARRPRVQYFNELLVQYPREGTRKPGQVVPENMIVPHDQPIEAEGSYDVPLQPVPPFWVLEYVSKNNRRKDYEESMHKYEHELKVPYYLLFVPEEQELTLYHHTGEKYVTIKPNPKGLYPIPELELELGLLDGWVRFWFQGEILPLPGELQSELDQARLRLRQAEQRAEKEHQARLAAQKEAGQEHQARLAAQKEAGQEHQARLAAQKEAGQEHQARLAAQKEAGQEHQARLAAEQELALLRDQLARLQAPPNGPSS